MTNGKIDWKDVEENINLTASNNTAKKIARESITVVKDNFNYIPISKRKYRSLTHIHLSMDDDVKEMLSPFSNDIRRTHGNTEEIFVQEEINEYRMKEIIEKAKKSDMTLVSMLVRIRMDKGIATIDSTHAELLKKLNKEKIPYIAISFGSPYLKEYLYYPQKNWHT